MKFLFSAALSFLSTLLATVFLASPSRAAEPEFPAEQVEFFEKKIRPLLAQHCYECHSGKSKKLEGELRLDGRSLALKGGESGAAVVPGKAKESLLIEAVLWESTEMPPKGKLKPGEIAALTEWIEMGAPWAGDSAEAVASEPKGYDWHKWRHEHWSFQPVRKPDSPQVADASWAKNEIDKFILVKLQEAKLPPSKLAAPQTLIRRAYFDLIGLPPTPEPVEQFVAACEIDADAAFKKLVDKLLESPQYGERWGRHWLDVARYSDGLGGFLDNAALPNAWRYRDWVVNAFNHDMPYDQFVMKQIAGDLIDDGQAAVATGFFALGPTYRSDGGDAEATAEAMAETLSDRIDTLGRGMLAMTLACSRCHDHKFDPLPQDNYYSLAGVFKNTRIVQKPLATPKIVTTYHAHQNLIRGLEKKIRDQQNVAKKAKRKLNPEETKLDAQWKAELDQLKKSAPPMYPVVHALNDSGAGDMHVAIRGDLRKKGVLAPRGFLQILAEDQPRRFTKGSGRLELAEAVADPNNPLTARVFVNRVWMQHFGRALVRTPSNFGSLGEEPTHPELLDWLTATFIESGWSVKGLHRAIMSSAAYRMSSDMNKDAFSKDGDNRLVWRMNPRRLDVESWRDALLAVTGELDQTSGGPPIDNVNNLRRTLYFKVSRAGDRFSTDEFLRLFDFPMMRATVAKRPTSIVPQQFLFMMNSEFMYRRAETLVARLTKEAPDDEQRIDRAYRLLYGRSPTSQEVAIGTAFVNADGESSQVAARWRQYAQVLLSANEFMYVQ
ncbi:MAG: PSD1 and planctomycete cytochrome C domain-containing protein [Planctomycetales bacterium]